MIGRRHFVEPVYGVIREGFPNAVLRTSGQLEIDSIDGYRRLARDAESRLGWRILLHAVQPPDAADAIINALSGQEELAEFLADDYKARHLHVAKLIRELTEGGGITDAQIAELEQELDRPFGEIEAALGRDEGGKEEDQNPEPEEGVPSIICTSLLGAKGLSAGYVFIVGFNDGVFPARPSAITDDEICKLIVGLSRTRKECQLVSCGFWGTGFLKPSSFLEWLEVPIDKRTVDKTYWS